MFDSLFEALFKNQGPEMVASITDVIKGREMGIVESAFKEVPNAVADMEQDEARRIKNISVISDALVSPAYVEMSQGAKEVHDDNAVIVQRMATGVGPDDIDLHAPEKINPVLFDGMSKEEEGRDTIARATDARARLDRVHSGEYTTPIVEEFEALPSEPDAKSPATEISGTQNTEELKLARAKLDALYNEELDVAATQKATVEPIDQVENEQFGLFA